MAEKCYFGIIPNSNETEFINNVSWKLSTYKIIYKIKFKENNDFA